MSQTKLNKNCTADCGTCKYCGYPNDSKPCSTCCAINDYSHQNNYIKE